MRGLLFVAITVAIPDDNGKRKEIDKLSAKNCENYIEGDTISVPLYCVCFFDDTYAASPALYYREGSQLSSK